ncbi:unannotated protein [freshwater metagenome]|uniref:Unannotated protein n=1 Tax=freshwater metagenome TaxID=449393 RepID=A0A6J6VPA3_9ZZZZ
MHDDHAHGIIGAQSHECIAQFVLHLAVQRIELGAIQDHGGYAALSIDRDFDELAHEPSDADRERRGYRRYGLQTNEG